MYNLDELIKNNNELEKPILTRQNIIEASLDEEKLKELCKEVFRLLCKRDNKFEELFDNKFLLCLFGTDDSILPYANHYLYHINNFSDDVIKRLYKEDPDNIVTNFIDFIANNIHDLLLVNLSENNENTELINTNDLVYRAFKAYNEGSFKNVDIDHLENIRISLKNIILHSNDKEEKYDTSINFNEEELRVKFNNLKMLISSLINSIPVGKTLLMTQDKDNVSRVTYYNKSECPGYIDIVTMFKSIDKNLRMDIQEGVSRIPIIEFIELLPSLI